MFTSILAQRFSHGCLIQLCLFSALNLKGSSFHLLSSLCCSAHYSAALCAVALLPRRRTRSEKEHRNLNCCLWRVTRCYVCSTDCCGWDGCAKGLLTCRSRNFLNGCESTVRFWVPELSVLIFRNKSPPVILSPLVCFLFGKKKYLCMQGLFSKVFFYFGQCSCLQIMNRKDVLFPNKRVRHKVVSP